MTKVDIYSGFLGAGKTTLIKKMIAEGYKGQKLVLIENEFGEIGIDGGFLQDAGINITEMNSGCICCSLVGDFGKALTKVINEYHPDRIIIEPSGVGKLSDVIGAVNKVTGPDVTLGYTVAVVDAGKVKVYTKNFGEFYNNQIETANTIILSRTQNVSEQKLDECVKLIRDHNPNAVLVTTPWDQLTGEQLMAAMEQKTSIAMELEELEKEAHEHHHHDHDDDDECDDPNCSCHHHDHEHEEHEHEHHHHDHDHEHEHEHDHEHHHDHDECCGHEHDHEHDHEHHHDHGECDDPNCSCHDHHHHHHADEVFISWGKETPKVYTQADIDRILTALDSGDYGAILRAKGIVNGTDGAWIEFDYVPEEHEIRAGHPDYTGRLCVIGSNLKEEKLAELFGL